MKKIEYYIEIMKAGRIGKGQMPKTKKGKIKIFPSSASHIHQIFADYGWMVTELVPMSYSKVQRLG